MKSLILHLVAGLLLLGAAACEKKKDKDGPSKADPNTKPGQPPAPPPLPKQPPPIK